MMGETIGLNASEGPSVFTQLPAREWPPDREAAVPGRRRPAVDGINGGVGEAGTRPGAGAAAAVADG